MIERRARARRAIPDALSARIAARFADPDSALAREVADILNVIPYADALRIDVHGDAIPAGRLAASTKESDER